MSEDGYTHLLEDGNLEDAYFIMEMSQWINEAKESRNPCGAFR